MEESYGRRYSGARVTELSRLSPDGSPKRWLHRCELGHSFRSRSRDSGVCGYCTNRELLPGFNDLRTRYPRLAAEMDAAPNSISSSEILYGSSIQVSWRSLQCGHSWSGMSPGSRVREGQGCPIEAGKRDSSGARRNRMTVQERYPELVAQGWDYSKNERDPQEALLDHSPHWWKCSEGHSYHRSVYREKSSGCPVCSGHRVDPLTRSFWSECQSRNRRDLLSEWCPSNEKGPMEYAPGSFAKVAWKCSLGHSWRAQISSRWSRGCPGCGRKRTEQGFNDLATGIARAGLTHLSLEWDSKTNGPLEEYSFRSGFEASWICSNNPSHRWRALISNRTAGGSCPRCRESGFERDLRSFLEDLVGSPAISNDRSLLDGKELDIYFPQLRLAVEANGDYWHSDRIISQRSGISSEEYHRRKLEIAANKGIGLALVWESDWKNSRSLVEEALRRFLKQPADIDPVLTILSKDSS